jgi:F-type H+-transporting ATPase subunit delta
MSDKKKVKQIVNLIEDYLLEEGQVKELREVVEEFDNLLDQEEKQHTAVVTTAIKLDSDWKKRVEKVLMDIFGQELDFEYRVDPQALGGIKIKVYDQIIDMTIDSSLQNISQSLKQ